MKIIFMGTPAFAVPVLQRLLDAEQDVMAVYSQPDRPSGRGKKLSPTPVKQFALENGLDIRQPRSLRPEDVQTELASLSPDVIIVAAYGLFLPPAVLELPPLGCLHIHPSLLPKYRGPSPVVTAILNGDDVTGVTIMKLDEGMDSGPILAQREVSIGGDERAPELTNRLFALGADLLIDTLHVWASGQVEARQQNDHHATITSLVKKEDGEIDWTHSAKLIARMVRAYQPWPGTFTYWNGKLLKIVTASATEGEVLPGKVISPGDDRLGIGSSDGVLEVTSLQIEGKKAMTAKEFLQGYQEFVGAELGRKA